MADLNTTSKEVKVPEPAHGSAYDAPDWEVPEEGTTTRKRLHFGTITTRWAIADRFDRTFPPYKRYIGLKRRTFLCVVLAVVLCIVALAIGLGVGLHKHKDQNLPLPNGAQIYTGDLTYYNPAVGACGIQSNDNSPIVAVSHYTFDAMQTGSDPNQNPLCGRKIRASRRREDGKQVSIDVTVVDRLLMEDRPSKLACRTNSLNSSSPEMEPDKRYNVDMEDVSPLSAHAKPRSVYKFHTSYLDDQVQGQVHNEGQYRTGDRSNLVLETYQDGSLQGQACIDKQYDKRDNSNCQHDHKDRQAHVDKQNGIQDSSYIAPQRSKFCEEFNSTMQDVDLSESQNQGPYLSGGRVDEPTAMVHHLPRSKFLGRVNSRPDDSPSERSKFCISENYKRISICTAIVTALIIHCISAIICLAAATKMSSIDGHQCLCILPDVVDNLTSLDQNVTINAIFTLGSSIGMESSAASRKSVNISTTTTSTTTGKHSVATSTLSSKTSDTHQTSESRRFTTSKEDDVQRRDHLFATGQPVPATVLTTETLMTKNEAVTTNGLETEGMPILSLGIHNSIVPSLFYWIGQFSHFHSLGERILLTALSFGALFDYSMAQSVPTSLLHHSPSTTTAMLAGVSEATRIHSTEMPNLAFSRKGSRFFKTFSYLKKTHEIQAAIAIHAGTLFTIFIIVISIFINFNYLDLRLKCGKWFDDTGHTIREEIEGTIDWSNKVDTANSSIKTLVGNATRRFEEIEEKKECFMNKAIGAAKGFKNSATSGIHPVHNEVEPHIEEAKPNDDEIPNMLKDGADKYEHWDERSGNQIAMIAWPDSIIVSTTPTVAVAATASTHTPEVTTIALPPPTSNAEEKPQRPGGFWASLLWPIMHPISWCQQQTIKDIIKKIVFLACAIFVIVIGAKAMTLYFTLEGVKDNFNALKDSLERYYDHVKEFMGRIRGIFGDIYDNSMNLVDVIADTSKQKSKEYANRVIDILSGPLKKLKVDIPKIDKRVVGGPETGVGWPTHVAAVASGAEPSVIASTTILQRSGLRSMIPTPTHSGGLRARTARIKKPVNPILDGVTALGGHFDEKEAREVNRRRKDSHLTTSPSRPTQNAPRTFEVPDQSFSALAGDPSSVVLADDESNGALGRYFNVPQPFLMLGNIVRLVSGEKRSPTIISSPQVTAKVSEAEATTSETLADISITDLDYKKANNGGKTKKVDGPGSTTTIFNNSTSAAHGRQGNLPLPLAMLGNLIRLVRGVKKVETTGCLPTMTSTETTTIWVTSHPQVRREEPSDFRSLMNFIGRPPPTPLSNEHAATVVYSSAASYELSTTDVPTLTYAAHAPITKWPGISRTWKVYEPYPLPTGYVSDTNVPAAIQTGHLSGYDEGNGTGTGACDPQSGIKMQAQELGVAISWQIFGINLCNQRIAVWAEDADGMNKSFVLRVRDQCAACRPQDLDIFHYVFDAAVTPMDVGRVVATWRWLKDDEIIAATAEPTC
ncbi:hypothetical protein N0V90_009648 [Kalmusia sp. IMI 367209]|nr:hypothetical protein N0V90_009648 [Kalmusia sp. IMI 367209]